MRFRSSHTLGRTLIPLALLPAVALGFARAELGDTLDNPLLPAFGGTNAHLLGDARANVFLFVKPGQDHSRDVLRQCAALERDLAEQSIHWVAVVSDRIPKSEIATAVSETGIRMPVLIDEGDALLGRLRVILHPVVGIADSDHRLVAHQPFLRVNFTGVIRARLRHLLGEIDDAALEDALHPKRPDRDESAVRALRHLNLAAKLHRSGRCEQALECVQTSLELDPGLVRAHLLHGQILKAQGQTGGALRAFQAALELNPASTEAAQAIKLLRSPAAN